MGLKKCTCAVALASAILAQSFCTVSAETILQKNGMSSGVSGTGTVEGYIEQEIMRVVLPTNNLNFMLDPAGIIKKTNADAYGGLEYVDFGGKDDGFVFFSTVTNGRTYLSTSTDLKFENKSSFPIKVSVSAKFEAGGSGIVLKENSNAFKGEDAGICFSITDGSTSKHVESTVSSCFSNNMSGVNGEYQYSYDLKSGYSYYLKENSNNSYPNYSIKLSAECDDEASWKNVVASESNLSVIWDIEKNSQSTSNSPYVKNFSISIDSKTPSDVVLGVDYNSTSATLVSILFSKTGTGGSAIPASAYEISGNDITIKASTFKALAKGNYLYTLKFSDGSTDTVRVDVK